MRTMVLTALLVAVAFAGCADSDSSGNDTGLVAAQGMAATAAAWNPDAQLVGLEAFEIRSNDPAAAGMAMESDVGAYIAAALREPVGDGRSSLWGAAYEADGAYLVVYWSDGVVHQNETTNGPSTQLHIEDIQVDSDAAADILLAEDPAWGDLRAQTEAFGTTSLFMANGQPHWYIAGFASNLSLEGYVNAVTGNITDGAVQPESIAGSFSAPVDGNFEVFTLEYDHQLLELTIGVNGGDPLIGLGADVTITDPTGEQTTFHVDAGSSYPFIGIGHAGEWTIYAESSDLLFAPTVSFSGFTTG